MRLRFLRTSTLLALAGALAAGALLFWTSQSVQRAEDKLARLEKAVAAERQALRVLRAEWAYLNRPDRLEELAGDHLGLAPVPSAAVGGDFTVVPDPFIPALPAHKPERAVLTPQPAMVETEQGASFQGLLDSLNSSGEEPDE